MARIKVENTGEGPLPTEVLVQIPTVDGPEDVVVHQSQVEGKYVFVGYIGDKGENALVELPRETVSGRWRVWVPKNLVAA